MLRSRPARAAALLLLVAASGCRRNEDAARDAAAAPGGGAPAAGAAATVSPELARADAARILGDSTAPLWLVVVSDFQCPYCRSWEEETAPAVIRDYVRTGKVRMAFINLPLSMHPNAGPAAEAAMCAGAQDRFWPVHEAIFATQPRWAGAADAPRIFDSLAVASGVDAASYRACIAAGTMRPLVRADVQRAEQAGVRSTPTFMISSRAQPNAQPAAIQGAAPAATFRAVLDSMLRVSAGSGR